MSTDWAQVYRATFAEVARYIYRRIWDRDRAQELAQDAFVRALDHDPDDARAWVFTIAGNLVRDEVSKSVRRQHLTLVAPPAATGTAADPHEDLERKEQTIRARRALASLSERDREVLLLWDAGLSYAQIAGRTGLAVGAMGTTLARARQRLTRAFESAEDTNVARG